MRPKKKDLPWTKNGRVMKKIERRTRFQPTQTMGDGNLLFTDNRGVRYEVPPDQFAGKVYNDGRPAVYYPENLSSEQEERNYQSLVRHMSAMKEWEESGRQGDRPFRFDYMMRPRKIESPELDKSLRPMTAVKRKEGRKPELVMRSNDKMKTGQEPNYYKVWDEGRKQWTTRPVEPEELDRYRRENSVFRTPRISF